MGIPLRVLLLEDNPADAELVLAELRRAGFVLDWRRVDTEADYLACLDPTLDIILADYSLPQWDAPHALQALQERGLDIPFIMISGTVGEDIAVGCIKQGAVDYLLKDRLGRLGQAVSKALEDKRLRVEKQQAEIALRESHQKLELLFKILPVGVSVLGQDGQLVIHNPALEKILSISREGMLRGDYAHRRYLGADGTPLTPEEFPSLRVFNGEEQVNNFEVGVVKENDDVIWTRVSAAACPATDWKVAIVTTDVTDRKLMEDALHQRTQQISQLYEAGKHLGNTLDLDTVYATVYEVVSGIMDCDDLVISSYNADDNLIRCVFMQHEGQSLDVSQFPPIPLEPEGKGTQSIAIRTGESLYLSDYQAHMRATQTAYLVNQNGVHEWDDDVAAEEEDITRSALIVPLRLANQVTGVIQVLSYRRDAYSEDDLHFLEALSPQVATVTANAALYQQAQIEIVERQRAEHAEHEQRVLAETLRDTAAALISAVDLDSVMNTILENVARVVPHDAANIMLIEDNHARVAYWRGYQPERIAFFHNYRFSLTTAVDLKQMLDTRSPFWVSDTSQYAGWIHEPDTAWVKSYVAVPIRSRDAVIGFLNVDSGTPGFFTEEHAQRLQIFGDQASIAIERAQLVDEIRHHATELEQRVKERTAQLNQTLQHIEAILNSSDDIIILCGPDGMISQVNPAFNRIFKCTSGEALFQPLTSLIFPEHVPLLEQTFQDVITSYQPQRLEIAVHNDGHTTFDADVVLSPIIEPTHHLSGVVCSMRDITQRKQMEDRLRHMLEHEMELSELKSRYVSMAAHDLRNPLAVIQSSISLVHQYRDRLTAEKRNEKFEHIQTNINVMVEMLDDILTLGKVESGKLTCDPVPLKVTTFCENIVAEMKQVTSTAQIINFSSQGVQNSALLDARLLRHILGNLLSNAIKYSPEDRPITFEVRHEPAQIAFRIQDQGIGIPEDEQQRLFETFHRASNARQIPGTGLGLAIVKQSVELHGGTITFESKEGHGTTFTVVIPQTPFGDGT